MKRTRCPAFVMSVHSERKKKSLDSERQPKNRTLAEETQSKRQEEPRPRSRPVRTTRTSPVLPSESLSWRRALKGATPVPGPTRITGVSASVGNRRVPFLTHRGTETSPAGTERSL